MAHVSSKVAAGLVIAVILIALLLQRLTRRVSPFQPSANRDRNAWGSLDAGTAQQLQLILDEDVNALGVPGLQAFVRAADGRTWSGTSGTVDLGRKTLLRRDHVLRVGSITKTFTAVIILKLVEAGQLSLDDSLAEWFPGVPNAGVITIRQLLDHSSGIPEFLQDPEVIVKSILPSIRWKPQDLIDIALKKQPAFAPGSGWTYSNTNYLLLGLIAERLTGESAAELLRRQIIDPLDLAHTYFLPYEAAPAMLVPGFDRDLSRFPGMLDIGPANTSWATAAFTSGALASTADDLGAFYHSLFAGELLSPASMQQMTTFISADNPGFDEQNGYGLGLMRMEAGGQELIGHVGEFMGSTAIAMYAPEAGDLVVVTTNLSYPDLVKVLLQLRRVME